MATPIDKGREFVSELLPLMSDTARAELETFISTGSTEAQALLARIGNGTLRQSDYSRGMNELKAQEAKLQKWSNDLKVWKTEADAQLAAGMAGSPDGGGGTPAPAPTAGTPGPTGLTEEDARRLLGTELNQREAYFASFVSDSMLLAQRHQMDFNEPLNIQALLQHPQVATLGLQGVYAEVHKEKIAARDAKKQADERERIKNEVRQELLAEQGSGLPYPIPSGSDGSSPLDHLSGVTPAAAFDPATSVAMYRQLIAGKPA